MGWKLTDEEFEEASDWYEGTDDCLKCRNLVALAQTRKLVERLEYELDMAPKGMRLATLETCLGAIKTEVGL